MDQIIAVLRSLWLVWLLVLFVGIVVWAYAPRRKQALDRHGRIPLRED